MPEFFHRCSCIVQRVEIMTPAGGQTDGRPQVGVMRSACLAPLRCIFLSSSIRRRGAT